MNKLVALLAAASLSIASGGAPAGETRQPSFVDSADSLHWRFRVMLDRREIGTHDFVVTRRDNRRYIEIDADFDVKILFVNAYRYDHENREIWQGDCLSSIRAETDDNGDRSRVFGEVVSGGFTIATDQGPPETDAAGCVRSFAYWNPAFLDSRRLLNAQTGEFVEVEILERGEETLTIDGRPVRANRYSVRMEEGPIELWYAVGNGQWLALEAAAKGGRTLRYEPVNLPFGLPGADERIAVN